MNVLRRQPLNALRTSRSIRYQAAGYGHALGPDWQLIVCRLSVSSREAETCAAKVAVADANQHNLGLLASPGKRLLRRDPFRAGAEVLSILRFPMRIEASREPASRGNLVVEFLVFGDKDHARLLRHRPRSIAQAQESP